MDGVPKGKQEYKVRADMDSGEWDAQRVANP